MKIIRYKDIKMLYCASYYDYPRAGWLEWQDKRYLN